MAAVCGTNTLTTTHSVWSATTEVAAFVSMKVALVAPTTGLLTVLEYHW